MSAAKSMEILMNIKTCECGSHPVIQADFDQSHPVAECGDGVGNPTAAVTTHVEVVTNGDESQCRYA